MAKHYYHIGKNGPAICHARPGDCPLKGNREHYDTADEAYNAYGAQLGKQYGKTATVMAAELKKRPHYKFYNKLDNNPALMEAYKTSRKIGKIGIAIVGVTAASVVTANRITESFVGMIVPLKKGRKINAKKLLMTKYWMPDIHSNKWR